MDTKGQALEPGAELSTFRIEGILGVGGCGITYRAFDERLQRMVAIKEYFPSGHAARDETSPTISPRTENDNEVYQFGLVKFVEEARTLANFQHPNIVRVNDLLEANGTAYIVMELEEGVPLSRLIKQRGQLTERQCLALCAHLLRGLGAVHAKDFLHRDVKPANILVRRSGPPVLLDFSAARQALGQRTDELTVMLTPGYAPIEQYSGDSGQGPWSDLYGLGATLFHGLSGAPPAPAKWRAKAVQNGHPDPISTGLQFIRSFVTPTLADAIEWMLQLHSRDRPSDAHLLLRQLSPLAKAVLRSSAATRTGTVKRLADEVTMNATATVAPQRRAVHERTTVVTINPHLQRAAHEFMIRHVGPIAPLVVEHEVSRASSPSAFVAALAVLLESDEERDALDTALKGFLPTNGRGDHLR